MHCSFRRFSRRTPLVRLKRAAHGYRPDGTSRRAAMAAESNDLPFCHRAYDCGSDRRDLARDWPFVLVAIVGNHLLLGVAGLLPRNSLWADWWRLPDRSAARREIALPVDDGPDPQVTPPVLDVSTTTMLKQPFFASGTRPCSIRTSVARSCARPLHRKSQPKPFLPICSVRTTTHCTRRRSRPGNRSFAHWRTTTLLSPCGRIAQRLLDPVLARRGLHLVSWIRRGFDTREIGQMSSIAG